MPRKATTHRRTPHAARQKLHAAPRATRHATRHARATPALRRTAPHCAALYPRHALASRTRVTHSRHALASRTRVTHLRHAAPRRNCWLRHVAQGYYRTQPYSQPYGAPLSQSDERGSLSLSQDSQGYSFSAHSQEDTGYRGAYDYGAAHMAYDYSAPASQPGPHMQGS
eukprot:scaffold23411_cov36-Phaeocystis_antarctica.AAC.1